MLLSIVIPTRNEARNIAACLASVAWAARDGHCERIVVDNHSADGTADLARAAGAMVHQQRPERSAQRNRGAREARGDYVFFLDADMRVPETTLREILGSIAAADAPDGLYVPEVRAGRGWWGRVRNFERSFYDGTCIDALRVMRRATLLAAGGYDETLYAGEDWDLDLRFLAIAGRTTITRGHLIHDEGRFTLGQHLAKKRYYSGNMSCYRRKWRGNAVVRRQFSLAYRLFGVFMEHGKWRRSLRRIDLLLGVWLDRVLVGGQFLLVSWGLFRTRPGVGSGRGKAGA